MKKFYKILTLLSILALSACSKNNPPKEDDTPGKDEPAEITRTITFSRERTTIETDDSYKISYTLEGFLDGEEHLINWTSDNENIASVDDLGYVYGVNVGTATIKASYLNAEASMLVTVISSGEIPTFDCLEKIEVYLGEEIILNEKTKYRGEEVIANYTYLSSDPAVVEVTNNGLRSLKEGHSDITITSSYHNFDNVRVCSIDVIPHVEIVINHEYLNLANSSYSGTSYIKQATLTAKAYVNDVLESASFSWVSSDTNVVTVVDGLVQSVNEGEAVITCSFIKDEKTYKKDISVKVVVPTSHIEETYFVNMLDESKFIDLVALGLNASNLTSVMMKDGDNYVTVSFVVNGDKAIITVDNSLKGQTKEFRLEINGEYFFLNACFKDYVKDKLYFADSADHLSYLTPLNDVAISYDATRSITVNDVKGADKENYVNEKNGSTKIQLNGRNEEAVILNNPELTNLSKYNYIVFYVYTEVAGYSGGTWMTDGVELEPNRWTKVLIDDFSAVMDYQGNMLSDKHYDPTGFGVRFTNYESPKRKDTMWLSSIYVGSKPSNKLVTLGFGLVSTFWWVNGVKITTTSSYADYYGHICTTFGVNVDDLEEQDKPYLKYEDSSCMEITYGGSKNIEAFFFPGSQPLNGYTDLVFYVYTEAERANEMDVYTREKSQTASLIVGHWTRVHVDLVADQAKSDKGKLFIETQNLDGFMFGIRVNGKAPEDTKFYVSSIYGFNY